MQSTFAGRQYSPLPMSMRAYLNIDYKNKIDSISLPISKFLRLIFHISDTPFTWLLLCLL